MSEWKISTREWYQSYKGPFLAHRFIILWKTKNSNNFLLEIRKLFWKPLKVLFVIFLETAKLIVCKNNEQPFRKILWIRLQYVTQNSLSPFGNRFFPMITVVQWARSVKNNLIKPLQKQSKDIRMDCVYAVKLLLGRDNRWPRTGVKAARKEETLVSHMINMDCPLQF